MAKGFVANTVPGRQKGVKYPSEVRAACVADMLVMENLHKVAKKHGIPESTMRSWPEMRKLLEAMKGKDAMLAEAVASRMAEIADKATEGTLLSVEMMQRRLKAADRNARRAESIAARLVRGLKKGDLDEEEAELLRAERGIRPPMGDYPLANSMRALASVGAKMAGASEEAGPAGGVEVVLAGEVEKYAE